MRAARWRSPLAVRAAPRAARRRPAARGFRVPPSGLPGTYGRLPGLPSFYTDPITVLHVFTPPRAAAYSRLIAFYHVDGPKFCQKEPVGHDDAGASTSSTALRAPVSGGCPPRFELMSVLQ